MKKILFVAPLPPPYGGITNWVLILRDCLRKDTEFDLVDILNISPNKRDLDGRTLYDRILKQGIQMLKLNSKLKKIILDKKPDVIHMTTSGKLSLIRDLLFLYTAKRFKVPVVYHIHFGRIPEMLKKNNIEWKLMEIAIKLSTKTIAIDGKTYDVLKEIFSTEKIKKVYNPFNIKSISFLTTDTHPKKEITFLGWCVKTKGITELIEAWSNICVKFPKWKLRLIGPMQEKYQENLKQKYSFDQVIITGEVSHKDAIELLNNGEIFILPSYTEGFPNCILEAMALKKPIIATNVGAIPEMLEKYSGILIEPKDVNSIEISLKTLLLDEHLREKLGNRAQKFLLNNFEVNVIFPVYKSIWKESIKQSERN